MNTELLRCSYNDCGWCYAPFDVDNNAKNGECQKPKDCPEKNRQTVEFMQSAKEKGRNNMSEELEQLASELSNVYQETLYKLIIQAANNGWARKDTLAIEEFIKGVTE